jgi:hypothetical protein
MIDESTTLTPAEDDTEPKGAEDVIFDKDAEATDEADSVGADEDKAEDAASEDTASEEDTSEESEDAESDEDQEAGAPEDYGDFEIPEGMELDEKAMEEFVPIAKELDLNKEQAQKLVSLYSEQAKANITAQQEEYADVREDWIKEVKADKEVGGKNFDESIGTAREALKNFGSPELTELLNETGLGDHPQVIKFFHKVGSALKEDGMVTGGSSTSAPVDVAKRLFPNQN